METLIAPPANAILATELITLVLPATSSSLSRRTRQNKILLLRHRILHCSRSSFAMLGIAYVRIDSANISYVAFTQILARVIVQRQNPIDAAAVLGSA